MDIPFLKKIPLPTISLDLFSHGPGGIVGIDIGVYSTKVVQLKYAEERAVLETYGELLNTGYFKRGEGGGVGFLRYLDTEVADLLRDVLKESNATSKEAVLSVPAASSFVTTISFPNITRKEIEDAIPFEARKYVPIPISEVVLDWDILDQGENRESTDVLLVAVPRDMVEKFRQISKLANINLRAVEVETFSLVRSLAGHDLTPTLIINLGYQMTNLVVADKGRPRTVHNISRGSLELTKALERGLGVNRERAEQIKKEIGLSEKIEEREMASIITPFVETLLAEIERFLSLYNRRASRTIQRINLTGGGSNLKGLIEYTASRFGVEVVKGNPFARVVTPAFMQPIVREIGPSFAVAVGLALHELTPR